MSDAFWETNAASWAKAVASRGITSRAVTNQALVNTILDLKPGSVLDIGCGEGWLAPILIKEKIDYRGIDGSAELIRIARETQGPGVGKIFEQADYGNWADGKWGPGRLFDLGVFNFSLMEADISPILRAATSALRSQGCLVIQTLHPLNLRDYRDDWNVEDFKTFPAEFKGTMRWFGRTLSTWTKVFQESGLQIRTILEPRGDLAVSASPSSIIFVLDPRPS